MPNENSGSSIEAEGLTLVDLAKILVHRKYYFAWGFIPIIIIALLYLLTREQTYEFQSLYQLAEESPGNYLEAPEVATIRLQNIILPDVRDQFENVESIKLTIEAPDKTGLIQLTSRDRPSVKEDVAEFHNALIDKFAASQLKLYENQRNLLRKRLEANEEQLEVLGSEGSAAVKASSLLETINDLESALVALKSGEVLSVARQSSKPVGVAAPLVLIAALVLATLLGLFIVYSSEFLSRVRRSLAEEKQ